MNAQSENEPFRLALEAIHRLLTKYEYKGVIIGGIAVGFLGKPRFTEDIDAVFLLSLQDIPHFLETAKAENIQPRIPDVVEFARQYRVLLLQHHPSKIHIDISLGMLPFEVEMVEKGNIHSAGQVAVRLPTPEDLIIMKAVAHRPKDIEDIRTIAKKNPGLDTAYIRKWIDQFAEALGMSNLWNDIAGIFEG